MEIDTQIKLKAAVARVRELFPEAHVALVVTQPHVSDADKMEVLLQSNMSRKEMIATLLAVLEAQGIIKGLDQYMKRVGDTPEQN